MDDVMHFTEATRRTLQFAGDLQQGSATGQRRPTSICYMRPLSGNATRWRRKAAVFHDKFTASGNACRPGFAFHRRFRQMGPAMPFSRPVRHGMVMEQVSKTIS
jgi:hypothetical protein